MDRKCLVSLVAQFFCNPGTVAVKRCGGYFNKRRSFLLSWTTMARKVL
jgi:hypothetical protein